MGGQIRVETDGAIGWIIFDQPERRNAVSLEMWEAVPGAIADLDANPDVRVMVLRGEGTEAFVAGADISQFEQKLAGFDILAFDHRQVDDLADHFGRDLDPFFRRYFSGCLDPRRHRADTRRGRRCGPR